MGFGSSYEQSKEMVQRKRAVHYLRLPKPLISRIRTNGIPDDVILGDMSVSMAFSVEVSYHALKKKTMPYKNLVWRCRWRKWFLRKMQPLHGEHVMNTRNHGSQPHGNVGNTQGHPPAHPTTHRCNMEVDKFLHAFLKIG